MIKLVATIHFIGICLFTTAASNDGKLYVVLPRIQATGMHQHMNLQATRPRPAPASQSQSGSTPGLGGVENHTAFLAFRDVDFLTVAGWTPQALPGQPGYQYIVLSGETISFNTNAANPASTKPANLPSVKCCGSEQLLPGFKTGDGSGAAAIFRLGEGTLTACSALSSAGDGGRMDTRLQLETGGVLMVWGETKQKTRALVLKGDAPLYIGNLPTEWVLDHPYPTLQTNSTPHHQAYTAMFKHPTGISCPYKPSAERTAIPTRCGTLDVAFRFGDTVPAGKKQTDLPIPEAVNAECSNSTWP
jgi:hypothetical protein